MITTLVMEKNVIFVRRKLAKIAKNWDQDRQNKLAILFIISFCKIGCILAKSQ
jgi:hypothetical protein